ncbi:hypothetical protein C7K25_04675 [Gulosibacter molinativorax]|uniref:Uncharacterized protein n=1 Tax=Gulosibacter molinativorax TaxID=256821 RepID=A0ABT7C6L4_9MICO|nr:hypothetical protein [Gulosibacter molinativorax]
MLMNQRMHWAPKNKITQNVRSVAGWRARAAGIPRLEQVQVVLVWSVTDQRRRDQDGPTPTLKAAIDGLVDAGVIDDDHRRIVRRSYCEIEDAAEKGTALVITELGSNEFRAA